MDNSGSSLPAGAESSSSDAGSSNPLGPARPQAADFDRVFGQEGRSAMLRLWQAEALEAVAKFKAQLQLLQPPTSETPDERNYHLTLSFRNVL
ncbi:hypothetical protein PRIPAC_72205 [Pristionchus pacificus]|uniref:Uncharacterized protein n=1 Tax=Pristionchus pacificus TaxID=54126 RepID=A0A2A6CFL2_PRIPA|nr:hypothetical protein PRIPAC_72205 [Pristionchus pacificus]|eukprot:PDM76878.1 hypothetical protein PRIPAC_42273 [Pristionchus pacificus]